MSLQTCSNCGVIGGPKGREGLGVRWWVCGNCGAVHDRDRNAAVNIARIGFYALGLKPRKMQSYSRQVPRGWIQASVGGSYDGNSLCCFLCGTGRQIAEGRN
jgi:transposase